MKFTKCNFFMLVLGIFIYIADIISDIFVASNFFCEGQYLWSTLTLVFRLLASTVVQTFSFEWFKDDLERPELGKLAWTFLVHSLHGGILIRYYFALKCGFQSAFKQSSCEDKLSGSPTGDIHKQAIDAVTDISMLRVFKIFLETTPQLLLQIHILMEEDKTSFIQYISIITSFCSISWATVDYQVSLQKSLPDKNQVGVIPKLMYFFYKLFTLTSWILSVALTTVLNFKSSLILLTFLWILSFCWILKQHTMFYKSKRMEYLYRIIVGIILTFTYFNIKGKKTKVDISIYYTACVLLILVILYICLVWKPLVINQIHFKAASIIIVLTLVLGIIFLVVYYGLFHPTVYGKQDRASDEVDGMSGEKVVVSRITNFIMQ
ncbi:XK-related protein 9 [Alligator sinensis]|uniref:XK-related protein n=1 Tax=Alligator sinensis TaxID=38654 RepID=A0A1U7RM11_ALLSI|nr:XK-related protein 9 [Alligator sinensis]